MKHSNATGSAAVATASQPRYSRDWLRADVMAGLAATAVIVPKALAYATIAGLPVQVGLYTAFVPMVIFRPVSADNPDDQQWPGLLMLRMEGRLFFANAERVADLLWAQVVQANPKILLLDGRAIFDVEYTALKVLVEMEEKLRQAGCELWLAELNPAVFAVIERSKLGTTLGRERMFLNMQAAVERFEQKAVS